MTLFYDKDGNGYIAQMNLTRTIDVSGNISISGTIFKGDDVLQNVGYGWSFKFQDEKYVISYTKLNDEDNTVEFDAVHKFLWDFSKSVFYENWTGSHTFASYLDALFSGSGYTYDLQTTVAAFEKENWGMKNKAGLLSDIISDAGVELEISNLKVTIKAQIGSDLTSIARYGINLSDLIEENNISNFATHGRGFGAYNDEDDTSQGRLEVEYTSDLAETYGILDLDPIVDERYTISDNLLAAVKAKVDATFAVSVSLNMYDLENAGYQNYDSPQVGDWILAIDEKLNFKRKVRIIKLEEEFDANEKRIGYTVTAGDLSQAEQLQSAQVSATNAIQQLQQDVITVYYAANGKNRTFTGTDDPNTLGLTNLISGDVYWRTNGDKKELWIYDGTRWNQEVTDATGVEITAKVDTAMADVDTAKQNASTAVETANQSIAQSGLATETATTAKQVADTANSVATQAKTDSATALSNVQTALTTANSALSKSNANASSISTIDISIDSINATMATKATQTDLNTLTGRVSTSETNISQNTKDIALKANTTDVNTLAGRVSTAESSIDINAKAITQKVSSSDVQNMLDTKGYATQTWTNSTITQKANEISSTVSTLQNQVNASAVGTNVLHFTNDYSNFWYDGGNSAYSITDTIAPNGHSAKKVSITNQATNWSVLGWARNGLNVDTDLQPSTTYTGSFYILADVDGSLSKANIRISNGASSASTTITEAATNQDGDFFKNVIKRVTFRMKTLSSWTSQSQLLYIGQILPVGNYTFWDFKLEKGLAATDYSTNPADGATVTALSIVSQKADSISQTVTNNKSASDSQFTNINQTISGIQSTVTNKADSSTVTQLANLVQTKVTASGDITNIVLNPYFANGSGAGWVTGSGTAFKTSTGDSKPGVPYYAQHYTRDVFYGSNFNVSAGEKYYFTLSAWNNSSNYYPLGIGFRTEKADGTVQWTQAVTTTSTAYAKIVGSLTIPTGAIKAMIWIGMATDDATAANNNWYYSKVYVGKTIPAEEYYSQISQLVDTINLRVEKNKVINQINVSSEGILIDGAKVHVTGTTTIDNAVIKSAMIDSLSASKLTAGTIDASLINVINLNANNISSGTLNGVTFHQKSSDMETWVDNNGIHNISGSSNVWIKNGNISAYNSSGQGMFMDSGALYLTTYSLWANGGKGGTPQYGSVNINNNLFSSGGIAVNGNGGYTMRTQNSDINSLSGSTWFSNRPNGSFMGGTSDGTTMIIGHGVTFIGGGSRYDTPPMNFTNMAFLSIGSKLDNAGSISKDDGADVWMQGYQVKIRADNADINLQASNGNVVVAGGGLIVTDKGSHIRNTQIDYELWVNGTLNVSGAKNAIVKTSKGWAQINAYETAEYYFGDIAKVNTSDGSKVKVMMDSLFLETVNTNVEYHVFVSSYGNGYAWVSEQGKDYFIIESNVPNLEISYEVKAKRLGYENTRLEIDEDFEQKFDTAS